MDGMQTQRGRMMRGARQGTVPLFRLSTHGEHLPIFHENG